MKFYQKKKAAVLRTSNSHREGRARSAGPVC